MHPSVADTPQSNMNITNFPQNVLHSITDHLESQSKVRLAMANRHMFRSIISTVYATVVYDEINEEDVNTANNSLKYSKRNDAITDNRITLLTPNNVYKFFRTISEPSFLNFNYSDFVIRLYLEKLVDTDIFDLASWRNSACMPVFNNLREYQFSNMIDILPLTYEFAPKLNTLIVDHNFCDYLDINKGSIEFFNNENVDTIYIKGTLGKNEDMVMFKLLTKCSHMIKHLKQLHFLVDSNENYEYVYRRIVGFFAILRKMNLVMFNVHKLSLTLTNVTTSTVISLISKHIIFENLVDLSLFIQDDSKVLTLVKSLDKLSTVVNHHGSNIKRLLIKYDLLKEDTEKNHLRSMMLLKLCESFHHLSHLNIDLKIHGLNFSNLLMVLGAPISNNLNTLYDLRINVYQPSENLIGNILPTLEDAVLLFPYLNFLNNCGCPICRSILHDLLLNNSSNLTFFDETIKVSTLLIIGQELDLVQKQCTYKINSDTIVNQYSKALIHDNYSKNGYLFDHLTNIQLNHSLAYLPNLQLFEICGLVYKKTNWSNLVDEDVIMEDSNNIPSGAQNTFELLYGKKFTGLDSNIITDITDLGRMFNGNITNTY